MADDWEWEQYRDRFATNRPETFEALVDVWLRVSEAQSVFSGWSIFSRHALAEPKLVRDHPDRVLVAENLMARGGYAVGARTRRGARRWEKNTNTRVRPS
jgi:hypothetical protein